MKDKKLIIFDFDGVLCGASWESLHLAYVTVIEGFGKDSNEFFTDYLSFRKWYNIDWHKNEERIFGRPYEPNPEFDAMFHEVYDPYIKLFPWVPEVLQILSEEFIITVLSSSTKTSVLKRLADNAKYFHSVRGSREVSNLKPHPEGVLLTLKETGIKKENTIIIGDMNVDYLAGKNAGIKTGLVKWGMDEWEKLIALKANYYFEVPEELLNLNRL
jgi:phosphoglycolate phosphatase-like HAD superfamily hydrolase